MTDSFDRDVIAEFRAGGGVVGGALEGRPLLLLHHLGARSGAERVTPLVYWTNGDALVVLASNYGSPRHPAWYHNLVAHPTTTVEIGTETLAVRARVADSDERRTLIESLAAQTRAVGAAVGRTSREIPVVILERR